MLVSFTYHNSNEMSGIVTHCNVHQKIADSHVDHVHDRLDRVINKSIWNLESSSYGVWKNKIKLLNLLRLISWLLIGICSDLTRGVDSSASLLVKSLFKEPLVKFWSHLRSINLLMYFWRCLMPSFRNAITKTISNITKHSKFTNKR